MSETANIALIASKVSTEIFRVFHWEMRPLHDTNFECVTSSHVTPSGKPKQTHPGDCVFHYLDPYLNRRIYLHTDLKSYSKTSFRQGKLRDALHSLAQTIDCASKSSVWRSKYLYRDDESYEIRGLLFTFNHDGKAVETFRTSMKGIATTKLPLAKDSIIHILGPEDITTLFTIATDLRLQIASKRVGDLYRFFYPDQTLWKRQTADDFRNAATIETLMAPYFILRYASRTESDDAGALRTVPAGIVVYYRRSGDTVEEFVYLLDTLLRYQLVNSRERISIRVFSSNPSESLRNNFQRAQQRYCSEWGFEASRASEIEAIEIDTLTTAFPNYSPDAIGWREEK